eukprot:m.587572 g.587572  ORF g.587572 m.587572 type:complete len:746 (+) comp22353_c0_seq1:363-2600(+)
MTEKDGVNVDTAASSGDSENSSSCHQEQAGGASLLFEAKKFTEAVEILEKLEKEAANDRKIKLNLAVARFYAGGTSQDLYDNLYTIGRSGTSNDDTEDDEADGAVLTYNTAVVLYQRREFSAAAVLLSRVYKVIEAIEEGIARRICLLLLDLYLILYQPDNAFHVLQYLERLAGISNNSQGKTGGAPAGGGGRENPLSPGDEGSGGTSGADSGVADDGATAAVPSNTPTDVMKFQLHQYRGRLHIITRSLKACKREVKNALNLNNQSITALFLKSNFEYARRNYRKAIKLLNSCSTKEPQVSGQSLAVMYYNNLATIHLQMGKYALAELYCTKALEANEVEAGRVPGRIENTHAPLKTKVADHLCELLYVRGLACLFQQQPERAFGCLQAALPQFHRNPRAWQRLAECCVQKHALHIERMHRDGTGMYTTVGTAQHRKTLISSFDLPPPASSDDPMSLSVAVMYLNNALALLQPSLPVAGADAQSTVVAATVDSSPAPAQEAGGSVDAGHTSGGGDGGHGGPPVGAGLAGAATPTAAFALPGTCVSPVQDTDLAVIRCHVLINLAYAHLGTHNTYEALRYAQMVLGNASSVSTCPVALKYLAFLYSAECLIRQGRIPMAIQHLSPANISDMLASPDITGSRDADVEENGADTEASAAEVRQPTQAFAAETAKKTLLLNLTAAYCMTGAYDQGAHCLAQVGTLPRGTPAYRQATLLSVFIALNRGQHDVAMDVIERNKMPEVTLAP